MVIIKGSIPPGPEHLALFDLDWTLIRPLKGHLFTNEVGWVWLPGRKAVLSQLEKNGFRIGIITNQKPWARQSIHNIEQRLTEVYTELRTELQHEPFILAALDEPQYRKPAIGWLTIISFISTPESPLASFFCGDAAGRPDDFSDSDIMFARNAGLPFYLPEQIFPITTIPSEVYTIPKIFVVLVGAPASGKTTFATKLGQNGWTVISSDNYGSSKPRIVSALKKAFMAYPKIVLDATNPTIAGRAEYIALGESYGFSICIIHLLNPGEQRNRLRPNPVPAVAQRMFWSRLEEPSQIVDHVPVYELL
jgi:bifunctional polynucleotide phosphatase/kinase